MTEKPCKYCERWKLKDRPPETFRFLYLEWDIDEARRLLRARPRRRVRAAVAGLRGLVAYPPGEGRPDACKVHVSPEHVLHVSLRRPVLFGYLPAGVPPVCKEDAAPPRKPILLDGFHRLARAIRDGREHLTGYLLTPEESDWLCRDHIAGRRVGARPDGLEETATTRRRRGKG